MPFIKLMVQLPELPDQPTTADRYINVDRIHEVKPFDDTTTIVELTNGKTLQVEGSVGRIVNLLNNRGSSPFDELVPLA
ncbi:MAG: hypothetical protein WC756_03690 [Taibaiella sp.]|jgi:uncharacterized protein YlzI (FlbEa/FlbD family)